MFKDFLLSGEIPEARRIMAVARLRKENQVDNTLTGLRNRATVFAQNWQNRGNEKSEARSYWMELLQDVLQLSDTNNPKTVCFERKTGLNGYIDVLMIKARVLVEQKSLGVDLDKPEKRQGLMLTPIQQAKRYADNLPPSEKPTVLITCNFGLFRIYDLEQDWIASKPQSEFTLADLPNHINELARLFRRESTQETIRVVQQEELSVKAGIYVAQLHDALAKCFPNPDDPAEHMALAMITVRIVFCLYAEAAGLFMANAFHDYVEHSSPDRLHTDLYDLFLYLDTAPENRPKYPDPRLKSFPYVDGGLFNELIDVPPLTGELRDTLLLISEKFDWRDISPVIFGSLMEETLSRDERRKGGMHYTSVRNIHRVIDPLFLNDLKAELEHAENSPIAGGARTKALTALQTHIGSLRFLDPACGSGNFLTETFLELRRMENRIIKDLVDMRNTLPAGQLQLDMGDTVNNIQVSIDHFYGIEINGFACAVARTALWIAEQQMLDDTSSIISGVPRLPFKDTAHILETNALRLDWNTLLPGMECDYVMGNPPFIGQSQKTDEQREDMRLVWADQYDGYLDYVTGWFRKASRYCMKSGAEFAFVSTNSICQGQPVAALFKPLIDDGWHIKFARTSFKWDAQSRIVAGVSVIVIGFTRMAHGNATLYKLDQVETVPHINPYLIPGPDIFISKRMKPLGSQSSAVSGLKPADGGGLMLKTQAEYEQAMNDPIAAKYVRKCVGADELIKGKNRWCLWLVDAEPDEIQQSTFLKNRVEQVRDFRQKSRKRATRENAKTPWLFQDWNKAEYPTDSNLLVIPRHFLDREYMTVDWMNNVIVTDACFVMPDSDGLNFAIIESSMFTVWQETMGGRLLEGCRFSSTVVWNNLPVPVLDKKTRQQLIEAGQLVLAARVAHPNSSLKTLYDPKYMPLDLRQAHEELDKIVDVAFGADKWLKDDDDARLRILFDSYRRMS